MNTTFDFTISAPRHDSLRAQTVLTQAHETVARLEDELSEFRPTSPVAILNAAAPGKKIPLPSSVLDLLELSAHLTSLSDGAFDCTVKGAREVQPAIGWDRGEGCGWRNGPSERISFAAVGKGFALEQVRAEIEREGFSSYRLDAGGSSLVFSGFHSPDRPWNWGWAWKKDARGEWQGLEFNHTCGEPVAIGVSGIAEQGFHLLDPRTQLPARGTLTALVALPRAAEADALSTALFVGGWEPGAQKLSRGLETPALALIDDKEVPHWNGRFQKLWGAICALPLVFTSTLANASEQVDLSELGFDDFTPYTFTRDPVWILLPLLSLALVILHLKKPQRRKKSEKAET